MVKALVPTPNTGGQHWERFHVLGRVDCLVVHGLWRYLSVTEAPHNIDFHTWMGKKHFCFFQAAETGNRTPNSGVKGSGANHYPRAPALVKGGLITIVKCKF